MKLWHYRCLGGLAGIAVGGILVLGLTACDRQPGLHPDKPTNPDGTFVRPTPSRWPALETTHDATNGVTCWNRREYPGTLSCLPDWMLTGAGRKPAADLPEVAQ